MPDTLIGLGLAIAFVLPGFITADLAESRRATRASRSDLELVLRGLVYALIIQGAVAATGWTESLVDDITASPAAAESTQKPASQQLNGPVVVEKDKLDQPKAAPTEAGTAEGRDSGDPWTHHIPELLLFALIVGITIPTVLGLVLSSWLRRAETEGGQLRAWHYALGARDYRKAWDFVFGRQQGTYLILTVIEDGTPRHFLGKYGEESWATQAPTQPAELYLQEVWPADADGVVDEALLSREPSRGLWVSSDKIERLEVVDLPAPE
jgi:Family of unknown function (DUF6338)